VLLRGCDACHAVSGDLQSEATLVDVRLDVGSLFPDPFFLADCVGFSWVGFLSDVIGGVESVLWEWRYPA
jgi:hypothetical protein